MADTSANAEIVVESIQTDAATEAAVIVAAQTAGAVDTVRSEVVAVETQLAEHSEQSEERHEEILEGQQWLENQFQLLSSTLTAQQTILSSMAAAIAAMETRLTDSLRSNPANLSTPEPTQEATPEPEVTAVIAVTEPVAAVDDRPAAEPERRRKHRVI